MGKIINATKGPADIHVNVMATDDFYIELMKNNESIARVTSEQKAIDYHLKDKLPAGETCYYVRVTQKNEQMAWSSPIWVRYTL